MENFATAIGFGFLGLVSFILALAGAMFCMFRAKELGRMNAGRFSSERETLAVTREIAWIGLAWCILLGWGMILVSLLPAS